MANFAPAKTGNSRVFVVEGRARPDHAPGFQSCLKAGALEQSFGDIERIECPDPNGYEGFIEVGSVQGQVERPTISLVGRYALDVKSLLLELARRRCASDLHVNLGACKTPSDFDNGATKRIIIEDARITNYSTDDLGALSSDENAAVNETVEISGKEAYESMQLTLAERGLDVVTNPLNDVVICSIVSCGDCEEQDDGCNKIYAVGESTPGSPGTSPDIVFSIDAGVTWYARDINTIAVGEGADGVACVGQYVAVVSSDGTGIHWVLKSQLDSTPTDAFTESTVGFVAAKFPNDIWSVGNYAFIAAEDGYVYGTADPTGGVTVLDAGVATTQDLHAIHALDDQFAVAVGESGAIVKTENQTTWASVTGPAGLADTIQAVWLKSTKEWWIGTAAGEVYYTLDGGTTWTEKAIPGTAPTAITDIAFASDSIMYISGNLSTPAGRIWRSYNGGNTFIVLPEQLGATLPASDEIRAIAACTNDVDFIAAVGLADNASDGIVMIGQD